MNYWVYFLTGLTTGGISCLMMQAGLLTSMVVNQETADTPGSTEATPSATKLWQPVVLFLVSKLVVHTVFGALLGLLGSGGRRVLTRARVRR